MTHSACTRCNAAEGDTERYILASMRCHTLAQTAAASREVRNDRVVNVSFARVLLMFNQIDILSSCENEHSSLFPQHFVLFLSVFLFVSVCWSCCYIGTKHSSHILFPNIELCYNMMWTKVNLCIFSLQKKVHRLHSLVRSFILIQTMRREAR